MKYGYDSQFYFILIELLLALKGVKKATMLVFLYRQRRRGKKKNTKNNSKKKKKGKEEEAGFSFVGVRWGSTGRSVKREGDFRGKKRQTREEDCVSICWKGN